MKQKLLVGISGASGASLALALLRTLKQMNIETHVIITNGGRITLWHECGITELTALADKLYDINDISAAPASGSFRTMGMIVIPCSMKTVAGIHSGYTDNLLLRAADVTLKERRKLVLAARETPLSSIHLRNLYELSMMGTTIVPLMMTYYQNPETIAEMEQHLIGKLLDQFGLQAPEFRRWEGLD